MPNMTLPPLEDRPLNGAETAAVIDRVDELLHVSYRERDLGNFADPLQEVVYILLSQQTREAVYQRVTAELSARWPTWQELLAAPVEEVREVVRPAGFPMRARQLQELLAMVAAECDMRGRPGEITLDWLHDLSDEEAERFLLTLPRIGPKSARCVLHYALNRQSFAVDTHVRRILDRLGLVRDPGGKVKHADYEAVMPPRLRQRMHVNLIHHGRKVCTTQRPKCGDCPLISFCPTGRSAEPAPDGRPVAVEAFAGGGGMGAGFAAAGYRIALAIEMDRHAAQTYRANHPGTVVLEADATTVTEEAIRRLAPGGLTATVIAAGPPCQGYSSAGARDPGDLKNVLYREVIRLARALKPRFVVIENVPGMRKVGGVVGFVQAVLGELDEAGYAAEDHLLRACDFGVPQLRHRILYLAQRRDLGEAPPAPRPSHCPGRYCPEGCGDQPGSRCGRKLATESVIDALSGLPVLAAGESAEYRLIDGQLLLNGSTMKHKPEVVDKISRIDPGKGPISYRRLHRDLARTIVAGHRALPVHPVEHRTLSVREAARIQGFDDAHVFCGPRGEQPLQVANAVPPALAQAVAASLLELMVAPLQQGSPAVETVLEQVPLQLVHAVKEPTPARLSASALEVLEAPA
jgi:DNA (cytosine-5)-methyltransferase 1